MRAAVGLLVDRVFLRGVEVRRLEQHRLHEKAVARLHLEKLRLCQAILGERRHAVLVDHPDLGAVGTVQAHLGRGARVTP